MKRTMQRLLVLFTVVALIALVPLRTTAAQQPAQTIAPTAPGMVHRITLKDGSQLVGRILSVDSTSVRFESALGVTTIARESIVSVVEERPGYSNNGKYYFPNPNDSRLVFAPTGRMLKRKEGYFSDFWIFLPSFAVGVTDWITIGGGVSIVPGLDPGDQVYFFTPKVGVARSDRFNAAVGAMAMSVPGFDSGRTSAGVLYGVGTWGSSDHSLTGGLGYGYLNSTLADQPVVMIGGETRVAPRVSLVTENYLFPHSTNLISAGVRFLGRDISVDLSLMRVASGSDGVTIPLLGFMWKW
jgi:hypothetical protein